MTPYRQERVERRQLQAQQQQAGAPLMSQYPQLVHIDLQFLNVRGQQRKRSLLEEVVRSQGKGGKPLNSLMCTGAKPIIVVPASFTQGNLALGNARAFLQEGQYRAQQEDVASVEVVRKLGGESVGFEVVNSVLGFSESQWKRVVAVFVNGQEWQFKDWVEAMDGKKRYTELFLRVRGYYLHFHDQAVPEFVARLNIKPLVLQRNKRHQDVTVFTEVWTDLEHFLRKEKFQGLKF